MARIIYALSGQGRGHASRVMAMSRCLRDRGHEIIYCCGGTAETILEERGEYVLPVPSLRQVLKANQICVAETFRLNAKTVLNAPRIIKMLSRTFERLDPDLLITDFEAFAPRAAESVGIPVLSFNHQQVVTEARYKLPLSDIPSALMASTVIQCIAPSDPAHVLLTSFYFPNLKDPTRASYVPPIIRQDVQDLSAVEGDHILVYYNQPAQAKEVLNTLRGVDAKFVLYNFGDGRDIPTSPNLIFKQPSIDGFLEDLRTSRAVICTAGFTLSSEALYLGKPLLVVPNRGIFEQTLNAHFLKRENLGHAVIDRPLEKSDITSFIDRLDTFRARLHGYEPCGNRQAADVIDSLLSTPAEAPHQNGRHTHPRTTPIPTTDPVPSVQ